MVGAQPRVKRLGFYAMKRSSVVIALDAGKVRVGVAVSDELGVLAHPRPHLDASDRKALLRAITLLAREERASRILVGLPLDMKGTTGPAVKKATAFAQAVADATGLEVELVDERLTTVEAAHRMREVGEARRDRIDSAAAAVVLQAWLDRKGK
jgi:putative Holliday junction resolvase